MRSFITCNSSPSIIRMIKSKIMRLAGHVGCIGQKRTAYRIFIGKPKGKRSLGRLRCRWEDNTRKDLREIGWSDMGWTDLA
jgi:hypothetical protein